MEKDAGVPVNVLRTDGGMVENELLMQFQADILDRTVVRPASRRRRRSARPTPPAWPPDSTRTSKTSARAGPSSEPGSPTWTPRAARKCTSSGKRQSPGLSTGWRNSVDQRVLGEFMGTMVLLLMGNGVVCQRAAHKSKAEGAGWIVITAGWAFAVMAGVFTAIACGSARRASQSRGHASASPSDRRLEQGRPLLPGADARRHRRRRRWSGSTSCRTCARPPTPARSSPASPPDRPSATSRST